MLSLIWRSLRKFSLRSLILNNNLLCCKVWKWIIRTWKLAQQTELKTSSKLADKMKLLQRFKKRFYQIQLSQKHRLRSFRRILTLQRKVTRAIRENFLTSSKMLWKLAVMSTHKECLKTLLGSRSCRLKRMKSAEHSRMLLSKLKKNTQLLWLSMKRSIASRSKSKIHRLLNYNVKSRARRKKTRKLFLRSKLMLSTKLMISKRRMSKIRTRFKIWV